MFKVNPYRPGAGLMPTYLAGRDEDITGIAELAQRIIDLFYTMENRPKGRGVQISVSCATFVPKPFTPFQFEPQDTREMIEHKQKLLLDSVNKKRVKVSYHDPNVSILEYRYS